MASNIIGLRKKFLAYNTVMNHNANRCQIQLDPSGVRLRHYLYGSLSKLIMTIIGSASLVYCHASYNHNTSECDVSYMPTLLFILRLRGFDSAENLHAITIQHDIKTPADT